MAEEKSGQTIIKGKRKSEKEKREESNRKWKEEHKGKLGDGGANR